jgi:hypothetical protein
VRAFRPSANGIGGTGRAPTGFFETGKIVVAKPHVTRSKGPIVLRRIGVSELSFTTSVKASDVSSASSW